MAEQTDKDNRTNDGDSDIDDVDFNNFKGMYFGKNNDKYIDPESGCHFRYDDFCRRLTKLKQKRKVIDKRLGLKTSSECVSEEEG